MKHLNCLLLLTILSTCLLSNVGHAQCNMTLSAITTPVSCNGDQNGAIDVTVYNGTGALTFQWSTGEDSEDLENLPSGFYTISVTDGLGCFATLSRNLINPTVLKDTITESCAGQAPYPTLTSLPSGGTPPYQYAWYTGDQTNAITLQQNAVTACSITVTDAHGCTVTDQLQAGYPVAKAGSYQSLDCTLPSTVLNGTNSLIRPGTQFTWSTSDGTILTGANSLTPTVSSSGHYNLHLFDPSTQCTSISAVTVSFNLNRPSASVLLTSDFITCSTPTATLQGNISSNGPTTFQWTTDIGCFESGLHTLNPVVSAEGTYYLTVTNTQNGCTDTGSRYVPSDLNSAIFSVITIPNWIACGGGQVQISTVLTEGTPNWTGPNGYTSPFASPVVSQPGTYTLTVTTADGCIYTESVTINEESPIPPNNFVLTHASCTLGQLGAIDMSPSFGLPPYSYQWSNGETTQDLDNLTSGYYTVTVTEATGCKFSHTAKIEQGNHNITGSVVGSNVDCKDQKTGEIDLIVAGGMPPYTFAWEGPQGYTAAQEDITGLAEGTYSVVITDAIGCTLEKTTTLTQPQKALRVPMTEIIVTNAVCNGAATGSIDLYALGGVGPYSFDWSNDGPEDPDNDPETLTGVPAGMYAVTITDANGCSLSIGSLVIDQGIALDISAIVSIIPCGGTGNEGEIDLSVSGGAPPYLFEWGTGATTEDLNMLSIGTYTVTVTDQNACTSTFSASITQGSTVPLNNFTVTPASCTLGASDGSITLNSLPSNAVAPLEFSWEGPAGFSASTQNISGLAAGNYLLSLTDAEGCLFQASIPVDKIPGNLDLIFGANLLSCTSMTLDLMASGGIAPYQYTWSDGSNVEDLVATVEGTYTVTVTDVSGCSKTVSTTISQPIQLGLDAVPLDVLCNGGSNGSISLAITGGSPLYTTLWSNGATTQNLLGVAAGAYCVTVTDINGCTATQCATVSQLPAVLVNIVGTAPTCAAGSNGMLSIIPTNLGTPTFSWNLVGPETLSGSAATIPLNISDLAAGTYCVTITNENGCSATACTVIDSPAPVQVSIEELSNTCNAAVLIAHASSGLEPFVYSWTGVIPPTGSAQSYVAPVSGNYQVAVSDANGCITTANFDVALANGGNCGYIQGYVRQDENKNCNASLLEPGLGGWLVRAEGLDTLYGVTDVTGHYIIGVPTGSYIMTVIPPNVYWELCPNMPFAVVFNPNDTVTATSFPVQKIAECPLLSVSIGTNRLRRCFSNNYYTVEYCNEGTKDAENVYIDVKLDPMLNFQSATLTSIDLGNNLFRFAVGQLNIGECGLFYIKVEVSCESTLNQSHCTEARIYPDSLCQYSPEWSGASLNLRSVCDNDSLRFILKNIGNGAMNSVVNYIVVEDAVMRMESMVPLLPSGDSVSLVFPANGSTWFVESGQEAFHPYPAPVSLSVEGCSTTGTFSTGYVNQFPLNDAAPPIDIDCTPNIGSYDPNDKQGFPIGYGANHYIRPGTEIEYLIRFQNTGTDTAFTVRILDTLSSWLDPASIKFGTGSHPYTYDVTGKGIVHFNFEDIMLPDSNVNEPASHGFVKFKIKPHRDALLESVIKNSAAIFFDFNDPVITNSTVHQLGESFLSVGIWQPQMPLAQVIASPNPFSQETVLEVKGLSSSRSLRLQVFDFQGNILTTEESDDNIFHLKKGDWPSGVYFFKITQQGKIVGNGKLIAQ